MKERTDKHATDYPREGNSTRNLATYINRYMEVLDVIKSTAAKVRSHKFEYMRSDELTTAGQVFFQYKQLLCCKQRTVLMIPLIEERAKA